MLAGGFDRSWDATTQDDDATQSLTGKQGTQVGGFNMLAQQNNGPVKEKGKEKEKKKKKQEAGQREQSPKWTETARPSYLFPLLSTGRERGPGKGVHIYKERKLIYIFIYIIKHVYQNVYMVSTYNHFKVLFTQYIYFLN